MTREGAQSGREAAPAHDASSPSLLSIVTVFWNGREDVARFFGAIENARAGLDFPIEVIAIDNASADDTADEIERLGHEWTTLVRNARNEGFALGCNQGLERARGDYLLLLNPDCEANAQALSEMRRFLDRNARCGAVGCALLHDDGLPQNSYHHEPSWWSYWGTHSLVSPLALRLRKALYRMVRVRRRPHRVGWLMGACLMMPRAVYERVGGLDPEYFMYSEDADWCRRVRDAGLEVVHLPRVSVLHRHGTSARRRPEFAFRRLYRSLLLYVNKHLPGPRGVLLRAAVVVDMLLRLPVHALSGNTRRLESVRLVLKAYVRNDGELFEKAMGREADAP